MLNCNLSKFFLNKKNNCERENDSSNKNRQSFANVLQVCHSNMILYSKFCTAFLISRPTFNQNNNNNNIHQNKNIRSWHILQEGRPIHIIYDMFTIFRTSNLSCYCLFTFGFDKFNQYRNKSFCHLYNSMQKCQLPLYSIRKFLRKKSCFLSSDVSTESLEIRFGMALTFKLCYNINNVLMLIRVKCRFKL